MKQKIPFLLAAGIMPFATAAIGQDFLSHVYLTSDLGAAFQQAVRIKGADLIDFHNGVRGDVAIGYRANSWFAVELASGAIWNSGDKIGGVTLSSFGGGFFHAAVARLQALRRGRRGRGGGDSGFPKAIRQHPRHRFHFKLSGFCGIELPGLQTCGPGSRLQISSDGRS